MPMPLLAMSSHAVMNKAVSMLAVAMSMLLPEAVMVPERHEDAYDVNDVGFALAAYSCRKPAMISRRLYGDEEVEIMSPAP